VSEGQSTPPLTVAAGQVGLKEMFLHCSVVYLTTALMMLFEVKEKNRLSTFPEVYFYSSVMNYLFLERFEVLTVFWGVTMSSRWIPTL
jgi:hypothetical protein